jgi:putative transposase
MIDTNFSELSLRSQFELLNLNRSSFYYQKIVPDEVEQNIANRINEIWLRHPFYGYRKITAVLRQEDILINRKKVQRLMKQMDLAAIF